MKSVFVICCAVMIFIGFLLLTYTLHVQTLIIISQWLLTLLCVSIAISPNSTLLVKL